MRVVAYCRVSTNKEEQLDSLDSQQKFFSEYASRNGHDLICIYADEGKSGTKMKNRLQLQKLLSDARQDKFELVLIKDVSRLARNTLDFLTSIRSLKALGIKVIFVNYDQTSSDSSEFMLTMLSAIAQEESANTSKRVKFGKRQNAEQGRVPNLVYGYDKLLNDYFNMEINQTEAQVVKRIFTMYTEKYYGANRIAKILNQEMVKTKRGYSWSQNAISRILNNEIYIGNVINGKQEVQDFLTGKRKNTSEDKWLVVHKPELRIVSEETFQKAHELIEHRQDSFKNIGNRISNKHVLSQLLKCSQCGSSFRRLTRTYRNTYVTWVCNGHNSNGADYCINAISIDEGEMVDSLQDYLETILSANPNIISNIIKEVTRQCKIQDEQQLGEKECTNRINKLIKEKQKFMEMYSNDIITMDDLKTKVDRIHKDIEYYRTKLEAREENSEKETESTLVNELHNIKNLLNCNIINNNLLKQLIKNITVDEDGNVDVYIEPLTENHILYHEMK